MEEVRKVLNALENADEKTLLSDVSCRFSIGDLKEIIINAMLKQRMILEDDETKPLATWQIKDTRKWHFKEWLENYNDDSSTSNSMF